uniref:Uncharacterized protein n=1 Tax=Vitis vinifera TaxID=29760 RepID=F6I711_VITVI
MATLSKEGLVAAIDSSPTLRRCKVVSLGGCTKNPNACLVYTSPQLTPWITYPCNQGLRNAND